MGCFFSKKEAASWGKAASTVRRRRSPPPTEPEAPQEETVKEVLSETAKPRARRREEVKEEEEEEVGIKKCLKAGPDLNSINGGYNERFEENFEVCSVSEGFSVSTTVTEKREGEEGDAEEVEGEARRTREEKSPAKLQRKRSVSGEISRTKQRSTGVGVGFGCGSGRSSPSPVKRREGTVRRTYSAREAGQVPAARSRVPAENRFRRDPGERSCRRSVSPAAKRAAELRKATAGGQCKIVPTSRANGRASASCIPPPTPAAAADGDGKRVQEACGGGEGKESLENPLVSLECFIFL